MITESQLIEIMPHARKRAALWLEPLNVAMTEFGIDTSRRVAAFLAQIAHESAELRYVRELASGEAYDTGRPAERLGNTLDADGDGQRFKGRGLIQITGRYNYRQCSMALFGDSARRTRAPRGAQQRRPLGGLVLVGARPQRDGRLSEQLPDHYPRDQRRPERLRRARRLLRAGQAGAVVNTLGPYLWLIKAGAAVLAVLGLWYGVESWNDGQQRIGYDRAVAEYQAKKATADREALVKERQLRKEKDDALQQAALREQQLRADNAAAHAASLGLRDTVADLRRRLVTDSVEACRATADAALAVFGECQDRYRTLAQAAAGHASDVQTLSEAWPE